MMKGPLIWLLGAATALLGACATHLPLRDDGRSELDRWVDDELVPYTVKELSSHPRFKGQPFLLVSMRGDTADASIDDLTEEIRQRMVDALLTTPGVRLVWPAAYRPWQHFGEMADIPCGEFHRERYYIGLDVELSPLDDALQVSVRALDLVENSWVGGFHQAWRGPPTEAQRQALSRRHPDENLRGLRASPFDDTEPDLLAAYLAHNLRCRLRHMAGAEELVIRAHREQPGEHPFLDRTTELVTNYLRRFHEARVTDDPAEATVSLASEIHLIHDDLHQVWVGLRDARNGRHLPGSETEAYVRLDATTVAGKPSVRARPIRLPGPTGATPNALRTTDAAPSSGGAWMEELGRPTSAVTSNSAPAEAASADSASPIGALRLVASERRISCEPDLTEGSNARVVVHKGERTGDACGALEVAIQHPARMFVLGQSSSGRINWIAPEPCGGGYELGTPVQDGEMFRFMLSNGADHQRLSDETADTWVYVIAIADRGEQETRRTLRRLMNGEPLGLCATTRTHPLSPDGWQRHLDALQTESGGKLEWRAIHFPPGEQRLTHL